MPQSDIIPPNVLHLMPRFVKKFFGYKPIQRKHSKELKQHLQEQNSPGKRFNLWKPNRMPIFMPIFLVFFGFIILALTLHWVFKDHRYQTQEGGICNNADILIRKNILFTFAHPDDEVMFFSPTILSLLSSGSNVFFLCLSVGNKEGLGKIRSSELVDSAVTLGLKKENVHVLDHSDLQDNPTKKWNSDVVSQQVMQFVKENSINAIITFDEGGVSGHLNHISVYEGVRYLMARKDLPNGLVSYKLLTTGKLRKFGSFLDIPYSYWGCNAMFVNSWSDRSRALKAMAKHKSQWVWFRKLYMLVSRYMLVNTLEPITNTNTSKKVL